MDADFTEEDLEMLLDSEHANGCEVERLRVIAWAEAETRRRPESGSYAKGQRYILRLLIEALKKHEL